MISKDVLKLADAVGTFIEYWGFRKIEGKVWLLIYLSKEPVDAKTLIEYLNVSKAFISSAIKVLQDYDLIREIELGDKRTKYYQALDNPMAVILKVLETREMKMLKSLKQIYAACLTDSEFVDNKRLKKLGHLLKIADSLLSKIVSFSKVKL